MLIRQSVTPKGRTRSNTTFGESYLIGIHKVEKQE